MHKKTVLVISSTFPRWKNDSRPSFVHDICSHIKGYRIVVLAPHHDGAKKKERMGDLTVYRFKYFFEKHQTLCSGAGIMENSKGFFGKAQLMLLLIMEYLAIKKILEKEKIDIVHAYWLFPQGIIASLACKEKPLIISGMGTDIFYGLRFRTLRLAARNAFDKANSIIVTSSALESRILEHFPGLKKKLEVIPVGIDAAISGPTKTAEALRKRHNCETSKIILCIGRLTEQKGIQYAIGAMPAILKEHPNAKLLVVGDGNYRRHLAEIVQCHSVQDNVVFVGAVAHSQIADYLQIADIFMFPSLSDSKLGTEAFGVALLEALSQKAAVVATRVGGIIDIIQDGKTGILVEQKSSEQISKAANELLSNANKRKKMGENGFKHVKDNFNWNKTTKKLEGVYKKIE
jgi:glycosyltransferase involved in cell wall biosynthesis